LGLQIKLLPDAHLLSPHPEVRLIDCRLAPDRGVDVLIVRVSCQEPGAIGFRRSDQARLNPDIDDSGIGEFAAGDQPVSHLDRFCCLWTHKGSHYRNLDLGDLVGLSCRLQLQVEAAGDADHQHQDDQIEEVDDSEEFTMLVQKSHNCCLASQEARLPPPFCRACCLF